MGAVLEEKPLPRPLETYAILAANFTTAEAWSRYRHLVEKTERTMPTRRLVFSPVSL